METKSVKLGDALETIRDNDGHWMAISDECPDEYNNGMRGWTSVKDKLPNESGWYLVFAPTYSGGSSSGLACIDGIMFSKFKIAKNGNKTWSIEVGYHERPNCVMYWMPLPIPTEFGHYEETHKDKWGVFMKTWVENETGEKRCLQ